MDRIDGALYEVMEEKYSGRRMGASLKCAEFAILGARVLRLMSGLAYLPVAGSQIVDFGNQQFTLISPTRTERRSAKNLSDIRQYHCWIQCKHPTPESNTERLELIDFTDRYADKIAALLDHSPISFPKRNYFWDWADAVDFPIPENLLSHPSVRPRKSGWRWMDNTCTRLLNKYESENEVYFSITTSQVLNRLADNAEIMLQKSVRSN